MSLRLLGFLAISAVSLTACRKTEPERTAPTTAPLTSVSASSKNPSAISSAAPATSFRGKKLHLWITSCDPRAKEVGDVLTRAAQGKHVTSIGVACTAITKEGTLVAQGEHPVGKGRAAIAEKITKAGFLPSLVIANPGPLGFDGALATQVLGDEATRKKLAAAIADVVKNEHFAAIELDLEAMATIAAPGYSSLAAEVRKGIAANVELVIDVHPKTVDDPGWDGPGSHDYVALSKTGAVLRLMTYDLSIGPMPPGPSTKASWIREVVEYARKTGVPAAQLEIGLPAYGYDYPPKEKGAPIPLRHEEVEALRVRVKATVVRDDGGTPHFQYDAPDGRHEVWFDDAESLGRVLAGVADLADQVRGVAIWGIGRGDKDLSRVLASF